jgi:hypothetical protein
MSYHFEGPPALKSPQPHGAKPVYIRATFIVYPTERDALLGVRGVPCYNVAQVAAILGISEKGVYELARRGNLPTVAYWGKMALFDDQVVMAAARKRGRIR